MNLLEKEDWLKNLIEQRSHLCTDQDYVREDNGHLIALHGKELGQVGISPNDVDVILENLKLSKLKSGSFVKSFSIWPSMGGGGEALVEIIMGGVTNRTVSSGRSKIENLIFVRGDSENVKSVVINSDYPHYLPLKHSNSKYWKLLVRVAEDDPIEFRSNKGFYDYFNFNDDCPLYKSTGCQATQILKVEDGYIVKAIDMAIISRKEFAHKLIA